MLLSFFKRILGYRTEVLIHCSGLLDGENVYAHLLCVPQGAVYVWECSSVVCAHWPSCRLLTHALGRNYLRRSHHTPGVRVPNCCTYYLQTIIWSAEEWCPAGKNCSQLRRRCSGEASEAELGYECCIITLSASAVRSFYAFFIPIFEADNFFFSSL